MLVVDNGNSADYLNRLWRLQSSDVDRQENDLMSMQSSYLPILVTKSYQQTSDKSQNHHSQPSHHRDLPSHLPDGGDHVSPKDKSKARHKEFRSRIRPAIFKGKCQSIAIDPESHMQLVKEKQALHEHRIRPKTPICLEPVHVISFSKPSRKVKRKNPRLTRSAPDLIQSRAFSEELLARGPSNVWKSENPLQLPLLTSDSSVDTVIRVTKAAGNTTTSNTNLRTAPQSNGSPEPKLIVASSTQAKPLKPEKPNKNVKPLQQSLKISQSNYASLREQRLLNEKLRSYDSENLSVNAQSYRRKDVENILNLVEEAQNQLRSCPKLNGKRSCGICPSTAKVGEHRHVSNADRLPDLNTSTEYKNDSAKSKKSLIVQLPNITFSRANTPGIMDRSAAVSAVRERKLTNTPADGLFTDADDYKISAVVIN